jgi:hypothetical protein
MPSGKLNPRLLEPFSHPTIEMSCSKAGDTQYTLTINLENKNAASILNNNGYKICVGYPDDDEGFSTTVVDVKAPSEFIRSMLLNSHAHRRTGLNSSTPVKVTFIAKAAAAVDYSIGYAKEYSPSEF